MQKFRFLRDDTTFWHIDMPRVHMLLSKTIAQSPGLVGFVNRFSDNHSLAASALGGMDALAPVAIGISGIARPAHAVVVAKRIGPSVASGRARLAKFQMQILLAVDWWLAAPAFLRLEKLEGRSDGRFEGRRRRRGAGPVGRCDAYSGRASTL
eukprot:GHVT01093783.1.p1 GENE.GHVT01093783.1~~GHVT01093783.1.p1  ORF type:complete len:153 (+),score=16.67 GHVT01093783.1:539-997(+)